MLALLASLDRNLGYREEQVSSTNPFVVETINGSGKVIETRPNWALIIPLVLVALAAVIALSVFLYRYWQKTTCIPICVAGKKRYAKPGSTVKEAIKIPEMYDGNWLVDQKTRIRELGFIVENWYTDSNLQIPLDLEQPIFAPVIIYPKVKKK